MLPVVPVRSEVTLHTHFGSGTTLVAAFLSVILAGTLWRLSWLHVAARATKPFWRAMASAALFQY